MLEKSILLPKTPGLIENTPAHSARRRKAEESTPLGTQRLPLNEVVPLKIARVSIFDLYLHCSIVYLYLKSFYIRWILQHGFFQLRRRFYKNFTINCQKKLGRQLKKNWILSVVKLKK